MYRKISLGLVVALLVGAVLATTATGVSAKANAGFKVGLLLPDVFVPRYETKDKPYFQAQLTKACAGCELVYANAAGDAGKQQQQADSMLAQGVKVLVVDPVDGVAAASIVSSAKAQNVPVIAYDRLIKSADLSYVISNDYYRVGIIQARSLIAKLKHDRVATKDHGILMMNGADTDNNAVNIRKGALSVIGKSGYKVLSSINTWDPAVANKWVSSQALRFDKKIVAVYSANDGNAGGAIAALKAAGWKHMPPITGLDATVQAIQAILVGNQYQTTYNAFRTEAQKAADVAVQLAQGKTPAGTAKVNGIPAFLNPPRSVTITTIKSTVIADGFYTRGQICTAQYKTACKKAGI